MTHASPPPAVALRPAERGDCRRLWEWRNEPGARAASFTSEPIPFEQHERWFLRKLEDPRASLWIALDDGGRPVGQARFDAKGDEAFISVGIDPARRGARYGAAVIKAGSDLALRDASLRRVVAEIRADNPASLRAFERAGFVWRQDKLVAGLPACELVYTARAPAPVKALFRTEAGPEIGLGHLQRCLSLAGAFQELGSSCSFLLNGGREALDWAAGFGFPGRALAAEAWSAADADETGAAPCDLVVVDSYRKDAAYLRRLRDSGAFVCSIEDFASHELPCQVAVNGSIQARALQYRTAPGTRLLLGVQHALLRREFLDLADRPAAGKARRLLVILGGADPRRLLPGVLRTLDEVPGDFEVTAVVGPFAAEPAGLRTRRRVALVRAPSSVLALMLEADAAVSGGGQTLYELARAGCPAVAVAMADNQKDQLRLLAEAGAVVSAGDAADADILARVGAETGRLLADAARRTALSRAGRLLVDGRGAQRVARALAAEAQAARERGLSLR